jgi:two-component system, LytTR family, response regulator LytT
MNILIVEDEELAIKKLKNTLASVDESAVVVGESDSIKGKARSTGWRRTRCPTLS